MFNYSIIYQKCLITTFSQIYQTLLRLTLIYSTYLLLQTKKNWSSYPNPTHFVSIYDTEIIEQQWQYV